MLNNVSNCNIFDMAQPFYYAQAAFDLISSYLLSVNV